MGIGRIGRTGPRIILLILKFVIHKLKCPHFERKKVQSSCFDSLMRIAACSVRDYEIEIVIMKSLIEIFANERRSFFFLLDFFEGISLSIVDLRNRSRRREYVRPPNL